MRVITVTASDIVNKYTESDYPLVYEYIGPNRLHGDRYFDGNLYLWAECLNDMSGDIYNDGKPIGVICLTQDQSLPLSLHLSCIEVLQKGQGYGSQIMEYIILLAQAMNCKSVTLQPHDDSLVKFYEKFGFKVTYINHVRIMRYYI